MRRERRGMLGGEGKDQEIQGAGVRRRRELTNREMDGNIQR